MGAKSDIKFTQISASVDMKLGGPSSVVLNTHELLTLNLKNYCLLVFGSSELEAQNVYRIKTILNNRFGFIWKIASSRPISKLKQSDAILIHGYYLFSTIYSVALYRGSRIYLMPHGTFELYQQARHKFRKIIFSFLLEMFLKDRKIHFITASESESAPLKSSFPLNPVSVVGLGVSIPAVTKIRKTNSEEINLVFLGRIAEKKRIDLCLYSVKQLISSGYQVSLKIIGTGSLELKKSLTDLVEELDLMANVKFLGHLGKTEMEKELSRSDIFILPSENENFAIAVAESIAAEVPVIVSKNVAMHSFVDEHNVGITIAELDSNLICQAVLQIMRGYDEYRINCHKHREMLSWDRIFDSWLDVMEINPNSESK